MRNKTRPQTSGNRVLSLSKPLAAIWNPILSILLNKTFLFWTAANPVLTSNKVQEHVEKCLELDVIVVGSIISKLELTKA